MRVERSPLFLSETEHLSSRRRIVCRRRIVAETLLGAVPSGRDPLHRQMHSFSNETDRGPCHRRLAAAPTAVAVIVSGAAKVIGSADGALGDVTRTAAAARTRWGKLWAARRADVLAP